MVFSVFVIVALLTNVSKKAGSNLLKLNLKTKERGWELHVIFFHPSEENKKRRFRHLYV